jgi:hypothetical protein
MAIKDEELSRKERRALRGDPSELGRYAPDAGAGGVATDEAVAPASSRLLPE